jgi:CDP-diacylglycerol--glycerol-3-phosphate 3-phosphatidyltransferase
MSLHRLKSRFQTLLRPLVAALARLGVTANQVTIGTCVLSVAIGALLAARPDAVTLFLLLPTWNLLRMASNAIDGMLAREHGQASALGGYLNELADVFADAALVLPFALLPGVPPVPVLAAIFLAAVAEFAGVLGVAAGGDRRHDGPLGKSDRALVFGVTGLLVGCGVAPGPWIGWVAAIAAVLLMVTIAQRVRRGLAGAGHRAA